MRLRKIILVAGVAFHLTLIAFNNIFDYSSNEQFVRGVLSMGDVFSGSKNLWRSIQMPWLQSAVYLLIIATETIAAGLMWIGFTRMIASRNDSDQHFSSSMQSAANGIILAATLWLTGFLTIAGEWFLMYQSQTWNAQSTAFALLISYLLVLLYLEKKSS
ncbi:MAG: DUF2165 domain-containing protein [Bacteroidetes bacterium]|nr:DUF2165 domain-containing protein [Bacteroidota bacterium]